MKVSPVGFGCYRVDINIDEHHQALYKALASGISLIDTSANYTNGGSERLVGKIVGDLIKEEKIKREDITIVTKGGYIQGQNYQNALKLKEEGKPYSDVVEISKGLWHSVSPDFLQDQLSSQLNRLNQKYIDVYLLHNPEYYLDWAKQNDIDREEARGVYYSRIKKAFEFLETKVKEGTIISYGISSNTFPGRSYDYDFTSLEEIINIAISISVNNHFKVIQFPFNLFESGAINNENQINNTVTVIEMARNANLVVLTNRPLNAITSKGLVRLADFKFEPFAEKDFIKQIKLVTLMEEDLLNEKIPGENLIENDIDILKKYLSFGSLIEENWKFFGSIEHYNDVLQQLFIPKINYLINYFNEKITNEDVRDFFERYVKECYKLLNFTGNYYKMRAEKRSKYIHSLIDKNLSKEFQNLTLSQKSILLIKSVDGVSSVLIGARKPGYIDDVVPLLEETKIPNAVEIIKDVSSEVELFNS